MNTKLQFAVLYRQFLFRIVDPELLSGSAQGDMHTLLGQFAALLVVVSLLFAFLAVPFIDSKLPPPVRLIGALTMEHLVIASTMLAVGLFGVLSWDSTFLDRRDLLVLAPLPVRALTLFRAKAAASAMALSLVIALLNSLSGLLWPFAMQHGIRSFAAFWITVFAAGCFIYGSMLCLQGLTTQLLPRRWFLRISSFLQIALVCLFVIVYFMQPPFESLSEMADPENQRLLEWVPSYWFLGVLQQLNGSQIAVVGPLARRGWVGLAIVAIGTVLAFLLSWFRTLRKIVEQPDITPGVRGLPLPPLGRAWITAIAQFSIRSLLRSRQHRLLLAFYAGAGLGLVVFFLKTPLAQGQIVAAASTVNAPLLTSTFVMLGFWLTGVRVLFARPLDLRANWIFRVTSVRGGATCLAANRRSLLVLGIAPVWTVTAILLFSVWPWPQALGHLLLLGLVGLTVTELLLFSFQKIPFTCSYTPGRSSIHLSFLLCVMVIVEAIDWAAQQELRPLGDGVRYAWTLGALCIVAIAARLRTSSAQWDDTVLDFEDVPPWTLISLNLPRGGGLAR